MDTIDIARYAASLLLVLALVGAALLVKRLKAQGNGAIDLKSLLPGGFRAGFALPARRLRVVESLAVGPRQRFVLIRRDGVEHLIFSSADGSVVVESHIVPPVPAEAPSEAKAGIAP